MADPMEFQAINHRCCATAKNVSEAQTNTQDVVFWGLKKAPVSRSNGFYICKQYNIGGLNCDNGRNY